MLPVKDFERLCEEPSRGVADDAVTDADEQRALLLLLHDLGVVVAHGLRRDARAVLQNVTLLDPNWLTGALYTILNHRVVADQGGEFARSQLAELLDPAIYPAKWHGFILDIMQDPEIALAFELPGSDRQRFLMPEALLVSEPDYATWPNDCLRFRYTYEVLPRGLIPRFIVQAHRNLTAQPTRWLTGVVLGAADCNIRVRGDLARVPPCIDIWVTGPEGMRRSALNIVLDDFDEVHDRHPEIGATARVPLTDQPELDVPYDNLRTIEMRRGLDHEFDPPDADRPYTVRELLEGVRRDPSRRYERGGSIVEQRIEVRDNARVTVVGEVRTEGGDARIGQEISEGHAESRWQPLWSWPFISLCFAAGAVLAALVLWWLPAGLSLPVGGLLALALCVFLLVQWWNPRNYYRRWLTFVLPAGLLANGLRPTIEFVASSSEAFARFRWAPEFEWGFFIAWALVVGILAWADLRQQQSTDESARG